MYSFAIYVRISWRHMHWAIPHYFSTHHSAIALLYMLPKVWYAHGSIHANTTPFSGMKLSRPISRSFCFSNCLMYELFCSFAEVFTSACTSISSATQTFATFRAVNAEIKHQRCIQADCNVAQQCKTQPIPVNSKEGAWIKRRSTIVVWLVNIIPIVEAIREDLIRRR